MLDEKLADSGYESIKENRMSTPDADRMVQDEQNWSMKYNFLTL